MKQQGSLDFRKMDFRKVRQQAKTKGRAKPENFEGLVLRLSASVRRIVRAAWEMDATEAEWKYGDLAGELGLSRPSITRAGLIARKVDVNLWPWGTGPRTLTILRPAPVPTGQISGPLPPPPSPPPASVTTPKPEVVPPKSAVPRVEPPSLQNDPEIEAIWKVGKAMMGLSPEATKRVLAWINGRFGGPDQG